MIIPFTKAHGAKNDFLLTWAGDAPLHGLPAAAIAICDRHTGIGADGWYLVRPADEEADASIRLLNSDGSEAEVSGNGTRCAAAFLIFEGKASMTSEVVIATGAGLKRLRLISREENRFEFEMNMGRALIQPGNLRFTLPVAAGTVEATILDVGNPQCAVFVDEFPPGWQRLGAELESHSHFPNRSNISFVQVADKHTINVRFYERGAGETMSSGTGSTGAAAAALARGLVESPVSVITAAGPLHIEWRAGDTYLTGPAELVAKGEFFMREGSWAR
jgi:diaminopimelate epimerase